MRAVVEGVLALLGLWVLIVVLGLLVVAAVS